MYHSGVWELNNIPEKTSIAAAYSALLEGSFLAVICPSSTYPQIACLIEDGGFEVRDMIICGEEKTVLLARKATKKSFKELVKTGVGGLNVDALRHHADEEYQSVTPVSRKLKTVSTKGGLKSATFSPNKNGRFPTNVVLNNELDGKEKFFSTTDDILEWAKILVSVPGGKLWIG